MKTMPIILGLFSFGTLLSQSYFSTSEQAIQIEYYLLMGDKYEASRALDSAHFYFEKALALSDAVPNNDLKAEALFQLGEFHLKNSQLILADSFMNATLEQATKDSIKAKIYLHKFWIQQRKGQGEQGLKYLKMARKWIGQDTTGQLWASYHNNLAIYSMIKENWVSALNHLMTAKSIIQSDAFEREYINNNLSIIYLSIEDYDKAMALLKTSLTYAKTTSNYRSELFSLFGLSFTNYQLGQYKKVQQYCQSAIELKEAHSITTALETNGGFPKCLKICRTISCYA